MQNKQIETTAKTAGVDPTTLADFPIPDWLSTRWDNPFQSIIDSLLPNIKPNTGDTETVNFEEFDVKQDDRFNNLAIAIASLTTTVNTNTSPEAISNAATNAVCNTASPNGCLTKNVTDPLSQAQNALGDKLNTILGLLNAGANASILATVNNINNVVTKGWASTAIDKTLNAANFALSLHNAMMLSNNVATTIFETLDIAFELVGIEVTDANGDTIGVTDFIKNRLEAVLKNVVGAENYAQLRLKLTIANRIYQAGMNILDNMTDLMDTAMDLDQYTGENIARIGNALRESGSINFNAYEEMLEDLSEHRRRSNWMARLEQAEEVTDNIYAIADNIRSIKEIGTELSENRQELRDSLEEIQKERKDEESADLEKIEALSEPTIEDEVRG